MKKNLQKVIHRGLFLLAISFSSTTMAQNVYDDIIAMSPIHTTLDAALQQEGLVTALQTSPSITVFAPTNQAFDDLANALGTDINGLLALPNLSDILTYHVLGSTVGSSAINNGDIVQPLSLTNTLKLTVTGSSQVFVNQALVSTPDLTAPNGVVHSLDAVVLPLETVADVAIDNGFSTLVTAVATAELLPALTNPLASLTVFAPSNAAFDNLATALGTDINGLLALPNLADVLTYHVLGSEVASSAINNGDIVQPLSTTNTLKLTATGSGDVFVNQAQVELADVTADNGTVHAIDAVVLPVETVVDAAIDNGLSSLATAVITAELLPVLTDPLAEYTVFAPTNQAFDDYVAALGTDINGLLASPNLANILVHHVVAGTVLEMDLTNGAVTTLSTETVLIDLTNGAMVDNANITTTDVVVDNGVAHVIDGILLPSSVASVNELNTLEFIVYPNPASSTITVKGDDLTSVELISIDGTLVKTFEMSTGQQSIALDGVVDGSYLLKINSTSGVGMKHIQVVSE